MSVDLLFNHLLFNFAAFVNKLLLTLDLGTVRVELSVFLSKIIVLHFKLLVITTFHLVLALVLVFALQMLKALMHLSTHLFGSLKAVVELCLIHFVLSRQKLGKLVTASFQVGSELTVHLLDAALNDAVLNALISLVFPVGAMSNVAIARQVAMQFLQIEFLFSAGINSRICLELL